MSNLLFFLLPAGLDIGPISDDPSSLPQPNVNQSSRPLSEEQLDGILSPELDKMVTDGNFFVLNFGLLVNVSRNGLFFFLLSQMSHLCIVTDLFGLGCTITFIASSDDSLTCVAFTLSRCYSWQTVQNPRYVFWSSLSFMEHSSQAMPATHAEFFFQSWEERMLKICSQLCWVRQPHSQLLCHSLLPHHSSCLCTAKVCSSGAFVSSSLARSVVHLLNANVEVGHTLCCAKLRNLPLLICEIFF